MCGENARAKATLAALVLAAVVLAGMAKAREAVPPAVRIGVVSSLFRDKPEPMVKLMLTPLRALMETQTGLSPQLAAAADAESLGKQLATKEAQLGVFHGFEFAWARQKHPDLKPLMVTVSYQRELRAYLVVAKDSKAACFADLKGKTVALPQGSKEHCHLFVERRNRDDKQQPAAPFARMAGAAHGEEALDDVVDGVVEAAVVDWLALDCFKKRKPGRFARLKTVQQSELFPAGVIAYLPGVLDEAALGRFRDGMLKAGETERGKQLLTYCQLVGFESVPKDYDRLLDEILKAYPPPPSR